MRGCTETLTLYTTTALNAHLTRYSRFPRIAQVACFFTRVEERRGGHDEVCFLLTSISPQEADLPRLLALACSPLEY